MQSAWRYFDAAALAGNLAEQVHQLETDTDRKDAGLPPMPPPGNPELAVILAGIPDAPAETGGDLYGVVMSAVVNAWMAGHIHGEDGCPGCEGARGEAGHDWTARMTAVTRTVPDVNKWFDRLVWTRALNDAGFTIERR